MKLHGISLQNFRCYTQHTFLFRAPVTVIVAKNAAGKTSVIEAISLLATGESFRADEVSQMIQFTAEVGRVKGKLEKEEETIELEALLTRGIVQGKKTVGKLYSVNGVRRRKKDFARKFFTVVFRPEDMRLIEGSPSRRRQFIDTILVATSPAYEASLKTYEETLKKRNRLLAQIQENEMPRSVLSYWNNALLKHGQMIQELRRDFFDFLAGVEFPLQFSVQYQLSAITEARMQEYADREIAAGHTLIGPHKDDFAVEFLFAGENRPVQDFGSRGQQRMAVLWLKMCEFSYVQQLTHQRPILLLDDILSELDEEHRGDVFALMQEGQSILTTTELRMAEELKSVVPSLEIITL